VHSIDTSGWFTSRRVGLTHTWTKVVVERGSDRIVGAHVLGANAEEVIATFAVAMAAGVPASTLRRALWPYPTSSSDIAYVV
jgi:glutathione reductase (NADPH)